MTPSAALLLWYDRQRRDLPWRRDADPYRVWLSEIMLQQTRVEMAAPYYARFVARFPDVAALAAAEVDEVLARWSGLGYYRRARLLHAAARRVVADCGGRLPSTVEGLRALPGIGPYTAAAVASIAFGVAAPVMDGNVERVTARLLAADGDPRSAPLRRRLLARAAALLDPRRPGDSNQALMELGATVCTPRAPKCRHCPLRDALGGDAGDGETGCRAAAEGDPERYPPPRRRRATVRERRLVVVAERAGRLLLFRRPRESGLLAGMWELPWVEAPDGDPADTAPAAAALGRRYGGSWEIGRHLGAVRHGITHRAIEIAVHRGGVEVLDGGAAEPPNGLEPGWFERRELAALGLSSMVTKALART